MVSTGNVVTAKPAANHLSTASDLPCDSYVGIAEFAELFGKTIMHNEIFKFHRCHPYSGTDCYKYRIAPGCW